MGSKERLKSNNMAVTLNEVITMQQMMIDAGEKLIHSAIGNQDHSQLYNKSTMPKIMGNASRWKDMIAIDVELLEPNWRA